MPRRYRLVAQAVEARPGMLAAAATLVRLVLARDAGVLTTAIETAQDAGAETATQKMLAHQLAAAHPLAMEMLAIATTEAQKHRLSSHGNSGALAEAARTTTAASRLMDSVARCALILDRLRNGARQIVTVQHIDQRVAVEAGGQALVAGNVGSGIVPPQHLVPGGDSQNERGTPCVGPSDGSSRRPPLRRMGQAHRLALPLCSDGQRPMQNAWRVQHGAKDGGGPCALRCRADEARPSECEGARHGDQAGTGAISHRGAASAAGDCPS
jgi:hypothetical protein